MDEEINKYNEVELIMGGLFYLGVDGICALLDFTGIGAVITPVIQSFGTFSQTLWAMGKGDKQALKLGRQISKYAANLLPWLPTLTAVFFIETYIHNHPKQVAQLAGVAAKIPGLEKKLG